MLKCANHINSALSNPFLRWEAEGGGIILFRLIQGIPTRKWHDT
jgi:hypothetical protein